ncbi:heavy-metal-associated domain-containing protein [Flavobacterium sp. W1B]|uniref:heavy-metal-associated domain-containing protein n=1 Tax=Flavobacterium sp. W1B TaxID=3394146 RepID=UPI0039BC696B
MKIVNIKFLAIALLVLITSVKSYSQISKAEIMATGLTCSMCSNAINKQLKAMPEVDSVGTDLNTNTFTVYFKKNSPLQPKVLKNAVEKAGFFVGSMVLTMPFDNLKVEDNSVVKKGDASFVFIDTKAQILSGETRVKISDKGFVTQKEYKKLVKSYSKYPTYAVEKENEYHVKTL